MHPIEALILCQCSLAKVTVERIDVVRTVMPLVEKMEHLVVSFCLCT
jgi:hypothetical protein